MNLVKPEDMELNKSDFPERSKLTVDFDNSGLSGLPRKKLILFFITQKCSSSKVFAIETLTEELNPLEFEKSEFQIAEVFLLFALFRSSAR